MKLINKYADSKYENLCEYFCEITNELDRLAGINTDEEHSFWSHYILADNHCIKNNCLTIRVPGGTVGGIWIDDNNVITKIEVNTNYVVKTYPKDVNEQIKKFVGYKIDNISKIMKRSE